MQQRHRADGISNADELKKIGKDKDYPMDGDYVLTDDIDLSGSDWTPIGGSGGSQYALVSGERVFNGTFDGAGHVISGLTIQCDGSNNSGYRISQSGLFAMLGSDDASDYAEVKNIVFTDVSISIILRRRYDRHAGSRCRRICKDRQRCCAGWQHRSDGKQRR